LGAAASPLLAAQRVRHLIDSTLLEHARLLRVDVGDDLPRLRPHLDEPCTPDEGGNQHAHLMREAISMHA